jgi:hypothetical protein
MRRHVVGHGWRRRCAAGLAALLGASALAVLLARLPISEAYELAHLGHPHAARRVVRVLEEKAGDTDCCGMRWTRRTGCCDVLLKVVTKQGEDETSGPAGRVRPTTGRRGGFRTAV